MKILRTVEELRRWRQDQRISPAFVPTMGALHAGHLRLMEEARASGLPVVVSIYVNPTQFNDPKDCEEYPRPEEADLTACREAGVAAVWLPTYAELYRDGYRFRLSECRDSHVLEGAMRPGHFDGVLTVVLKLFQLVQPAKAFFGEKDWQQLSLVRDMVSAFFLPLEIIPVATVREHDGLAMSSRNRRLSDTGRSMAARFPQILQTAAAPAEAERRLEEAGFQVEYVADRDGRRLGAVVLEGVRLIDNFDLKALEVIV